MNPSICVLLLLISTFFSISFSTTTFTFINKCHFTVWPAILSNAGHPPLSSTGFELPTDASRSLQSPPNWSGRLWARTGCVFHNSNNGSCATGETPPATLAEFSLAGGERNNVDFYDVSLVDGFNLAMVVEGGKGRCAATGCVVDLNQRCPAELRIGEGETAACRSACEAFRRPEYCCSGEFASPAAWRPTAYSEMFKAACPKSYSYAFDDSTSTFTCADAGEFTVTFCPESTPRNGGIGPLPPPLGRRLAVSTSPLADLEEAPTLVTSWPTLDQAPLKERCCPRGIEHGLGGSQPHSRTNQAKQWWVQEII